MSTASMQDAIVSNSCGAHAAKMGTEARDWTSGNAAVLITDPFCYECAPRRCLNGLARRRLDPRCRASCQRRHRGRRGLRNRDDTQSPLDRKTLLQFAVSWYADTAEE